MSKHSLSYSKDEKFSSTIIKEALAMKDGGRQYSEGFAAGRNEVLCSLLCHGFDDRALQHIFSISEEELKNLAGTVSGMLKMRDAEEC